MRRVLAVARRQLVRSLAIAGVVGSVLLLINHGDHLAREPVCADFWAKCGLTYAVPFVVSTVSAVLAESAETRS